LIVRGYLENFSHGIASGDKTLWLAYSGDAEELEPRSDHRSKLGRILPKISQYMTILDKRDSGFRKERTKSPFGALDRGLFSLY
jgi:hypothetical protein